MSIALTPWYCCNQSSAPGSTVPLLVAITAPSSGVNPMLVSTLRPSRTAHAETPEPMWVSSSCRVPGWRPRISAARCVAHAWDRPRLLEPALTARTRTSGQARLSSATASPGSRACPRGVRTRSRGVGGACPHRAGPTPPRRRAHGGSKRREHKVVPLISLRTTMSNVVVVVPCSLYPRAWNRSASWSTVDHLVERPRVAVERHDHVHRLGEQGLERRRRDGVGMHRTRFRAGDVPQCPSRRGLMWSGSRAHAGAGWPGGRSGQPSGSWRPSSGPGARRRRPTRRGRAGAPLPHPRAHGHCCPRPVSTGCRRHPRDECRHLVQGGVEDSGEAMAGAWIRHQAGVREQVH